MQTAYEALEPQAQEVHVEIGDLQERVAKLSEKLGNMQDTLDDARPQDDEERGTENALALVQMECAHLQYHLSSASTMLNIAYPSEARKREQEAMAAFFKDLKAVAAALGSEEPSEEDLAKMQNRENN